MCNSVFHIKIMEQRSGRCIKTSVFDRLEDSPVGKFFRLYHDKSPQIVFPDIMSIIRSKTENFISYKQKMIKIRLRITVVSEKFGTVVVDFHTDHTLQIFDIGRIDFRPVRVTIQCYISSLSEIFDDTLRCCQHTVSTFFFKSIMFRYPVCLRQTEAYQMMILSSRQLNIQLRSRKYQKIIPVQFRMNPVNPVICQCQKIISFAAIMFCSLCRRMHTV